MYSNFIRKGERPPLCRPCGSSSVFRFFEDDDEVKTTPSKTPAIVVARLSYADGKNLLIHKKEARGSWKSSPGPRSPGALRYISGHFEDFFPRKIWYQDVPSSSFLPNSNGDMYSPFYLICWLLRFRVEVQVSQAARRRQRDPQRWSNLLDQALLSKLGLPSSLVGFSSLVSFHQFERVSNTSAPIHWLRRG